jgi:predicted PurR-regulated permease PerM
MVWQLSWRFLETLASSSSSTTPQWTNGTHAITWNNGTHVMVIQTTGNTENDAMATPIHATTTTFDENDTSNAPIIWAAVLLGVVTVCTLVLCYLVLPTMLHALHRLVAAKIASSASRIQRRYETIEGWLISKVCVCVLYSIVVCYFWQITHVSFSILLFPRLL